MAAEFPSELRSILALMAGSAPGSPAPPSIAAALGLPADTSHGPRPGVTFEDLAQGAFQRCPDTPAGRAVKMVVADIYTACRERMVFPPPTVLKYLEGYSKEYLIRVLQGPEAYPVWYERVLGFVEGREREAPELGPKIPADAGRSEHYEHTFYWFAKKTVNGGRAFDEANKDVVALKSLPAELKGIFHDALEEEAGAEKGEATGP